MTVTVITAPTEEPITLAEAKAHCRVDISTDDTLISSLITAARQWCESYDWRRYITQTLEFRCSAWPVSDYFVLPYPPLQAVNSVKYYDVDSVEYTLDAGLYQIDWYSTPGGFYLLDNESWPTTSLRKRNAIVVNYDVGYGSAADVPLTIRQAILMLVGHWYESREGVLTGAMSKAIEFGVTSLLNVNRAFQY